MKRFVIDITLTDYEVAHLLQLMRTIPNTDDWYTSIICKIQSAIENLHLPIDYSS